MLDLKANADYMALVLFRLCVLTSPLYFIFNCSCSILIVNQKDICCCHFKELLR